MKILRVKSREDFNNVNAPADRVLIWPQINADNTVTLYCKTPSGEVSTITGGSGSGSDYDDSEIRSLLAGKVDKITGKGLSTNDYTDAEKQKIANLKTVATTGSYNDLANKPSIPSRVSELANDTGYITAAAIPAVPSRVSELANDAGYITAAAIPPVPSVPSVLADLSDVSGTSNAFDGQALIYDVESQAWRPGSIAGEAGNQASLLKFTQQNLVDRKLTLEANLLAFAVIDEQGIQYSFAPEEVVYAETATIVDLAVTMQRRNLSDVIPGIWKIVIVAKNSSVGDPETDNQISLYEFTQENLLDRKLSLEGTPLAFAVIDEQGVQYPFAPEEVIYTETATIVDLSVTMQRRNLADAIPGIWKIVIAAEGVPAIAYDDTELRAELANKVDKITGKGLSTNDYTDAEKQQLATLKPVATTGSYNDLTDRPTIPSDLSDLSDTSNLLASKANLADLIMPRSTAQYEQIPVGPTRQYKTLAEAYIYMQTKNTGSKGFRLVLDPGNHEGIQFANINVQIFSADSANKAVITSPLIFSVCFYPVITNVNFNIASTAAYAIMFSTCFRPYIVNCSITSLTTNWGIHAGGCYGGYFENVTINLQDKADSIGLHLVRSSGFTALNTRISNCADGVYLEGASSLYFSTPVSTISNCRRGVVANNMSSIYAHSTVVTIDSSVTAYSSPAVNTVGNYNSFIRG